jgi:hypothetical protein
MYTRKCKNILNKKQETYKSRKGKKEKKKKKICSKKLFLKVRFRPKK